jgi:hypothetical protein
MKYALQGFVKTNNNGRRNAVQQIVPDSNDPRVHNVEYVCVDTVDTDDIAYLVFDVKFETKNDRDTLFSTMKALEGIIGGCVVGSYVRAYKNKHDEGLRCEAESEIRKT